MQKKYIKLSSFWIYYVFMFSFIDLVVTGDLRLSCFTKMRQIVTGKFFPELI